MTGGEAGFRRHGDDHHPGHFLTLGGGRAEFIEKAYWCPLDETWHGSRKWLARRIRKFGYTNERYYREFGEAHMPVEWEANTKDPKYGSSQNTPSCLMCDAPVAFEEGKWQYPKFCGFSCSTTWHAKNTDRVEQAQSTLKARIQADPTHGLRPNQLAYWTTKGYTETDAKAEIRKRQATNTEEAFIRRANGDVEEGRRRHTERQAKWLESVKKSGMYKGISKVSEELFARIADQVPGIRYGQNEVVVRLVDRACKVDCVLRESKRVIEFYGDFWHGNPKKYAPDDRIGKKSTAAEKWEADRKRIADLNAAGFRTLVVWEDEYRENRDGTVAACVEFLAAG